MLTPLGRGPASGPGGCGDDAGAAETGPRTIRGAQAELLGELRALEARVEAVSALLVRQRRQVEAWSDRLYGPAPAGTAARRLMSLKHARG